MASKAQRPASLLNAVKWSYVAGWGERAASAGFTLLLAALAGPHDFGLVVVATTYIAFLQLFLDQGLACALIQKPDLAHDQINAVFWLTLTLSALLVLVSVLGGHWWARANHAPQVATLIDVLSVLLPLEALSAVPRAIVQRRMDFRSLSVRANACALAGGGIGLALAYAGLGLWALVGQQIVAAATGIPLLWAFCAWRPGLSFSWRSLRSLLGFSVANFAAQLAVFAEAQSASLLLGIFLGPSAVGLYRFADRIVGTVVAGATSSVQAVSLPEFSRLQGTPQALRASVLTCIRLSCAMTLPALLGLAAVATPLIAVVGSRWLPAVGVLRILCLSNAMLILTFFTGPLLQAIGRPHRLALLEWGRVLAGVMLLLAVGLALAGRPVHRQLAGFAASRLLFGGLVVVPVFLAVLMRRTGISPGDLVTATGPAWAASVAAAACVLLFYNSGLAPSGHAISLLLAGTAVGAITGTAALLGLDRWLRDTVLSRLRPAWTGL